VINHIIFCSSFAGRNDERTSFLKKIGQELVRFYACENRNPLVVKRAVQNINPKFILIFF
jgi:hypothetical protein